MTSPVVRERTVRNALLDDVRRGLTRRQKEIPPKYFYDQIGSELFEEITRLPEYYLTRAERRLLAAWALPIMASLQPVTLVELGAGSGDKTRLLLRAMRTAGTGRRYIPIDLSADFLEESAARLRLDFPGLAVEPRVADFTHGIDVPPRDGAALIAFLGSTIGNLSTADAVSLLRGVRQAMRGEDRFLLGVDLRTKSIEKIERAYTDRAGVTARFNRNVLVRLNRELGATFHVDAFAHRATWSPAHHRIEMHLVATRDQRVSIPGLGWVAFRAGESILTETCAKYDRTDVERLLGAASLRIERWLVDLEDQYALVVAAPLTGTTR
jgi:L-histidine N-alpha-methyltransferase